MERRRCLKHCNWLSLLTGAAAGFLLCFVFAALPSGVECRETIKFVEEAGDPDMPDRFEGGPVLVPGVTVSLPGDARPLEMPRRERTVSRFTRHQPWRDSVRHGLTIARLFWAWSSIASWRFAF